jgi:hypothetical protein
MLITKTILVDIETIMDLVGLDLSYLSGWCWYWLLAQRRGRQQPSVSDITHGCAIDPASAKVWLGHNLIVSQSRCLLPWLACAVIASEHMPLLTSFVGGATAQLQHDTAGAPLHREVSVVLIIRGPQIMIDGIGTPWTFTAYGHCDECNVERFGYCGHGNSFRSASVWMVTASARLAVIPLAEVQPCCRLLLVLCQP